jgi:hypothetical protein
MNTEQTSPCKTSGPLATAFHETLKIELLGEHVLFYFPLEYFILGMVKEENAAAQSVTYQAGPSPKRRPEGQ